VRVIDEEGNNLGVLATREALDYARTKELDLVEVAPNAKPPVCRVMDFGKFMYEQTKKEREAKRAQKVVEVKELRLSPKTGDYHLGFKVKQARGFLEKGFKVRFRIRFKGRESQHPEIARETFEEVVKELNDLADVEQTPVFEGRSMTLLLNPKSAK
jgi:translation initiation factor IF-3